MNRKKEMSVLIPIHNSETIHRSSNTFFYHAYV